MKTLCDVRESSYGSAAHMTEVIADYGNGSLGNGVRKLMDKSWQKGSAYTVGAITILGLVILAVDGIIKTGKKNKLQNRRKGEVIMEKYKIQLVDNDGVIEDNVNDVIFNNEEEAQEYADYLNSCTSDGAENLKMNNPYDYEEDYCDCEDSGYVVAEVE